MALNLLNQPSKDLLEQLDWYLIVDKITNTTHFDATKEDLRRPPSYQEKESLLKMHESLRYLMEMIRFGTQQDFRSALLSLPSDRGYEDLTGRLEKLSVLSIPELHQLARHLECYFVLGRHLRDWIYFKDFQLDGTQTQKLQQNFIHPLRVFVTTDGEINYEASPRLAPHYHQLQKLEATLRFQLRELINRQFADSLQYDQFDIVNDHYVLPVKSHLYRSGMGMIVAHSDSGMTLFVEPLSIKKLATERLSLLARIEEELFLLCKELTSTLFPYVELFKKLRQFCYFIDLSYAKALFCFDHDLVEPELIDQPAIHLTAFYHPLLTKPVKNDIKLDSSDLGLILSGPNTGGKTVALKSITLANLFLHWGLFIPALEAQLFPFKAIFYFGRDSQDLSQGLSSFAAEVKNYLLLLNELENENIVVIDEIFSSTSSEEASALALTLFTEMHKKHQTFVLASTHHQMLKALVHQEKQYRSAHVGLNPETSGPTYKIIEGLPGSSMALTIFEQLSKSFGFPNHLARKAQKILAEKAQNYEILLQEVSAHKIELEKLLEINQKKEEELKQKQKQQESQLKARMEHRLSQFDDKLRKNLLRAQQLLKTMEEEKVKTPKTYIRSLQDVQTKQSHYKELVQQTQVNDDLPYLMQTLREENIKIGETYFCIALNKKVIVKEIISKKQICLVVSGSISFHAKFKDLRPLKGGQQNQHEKERVYIHREMSNSDEDFSMAPQWDARGLRLEAFQKEVERYLDLLLAGDIFEIVILHGHGPLKTWLRELLKGHPHFSYEVPEKPGDSVTRVFCS